MASPTAPRRAPVPRPELTAERAADKGVEGNARLTGSIAAVLLLLLAAEGATILRIGPLLRAHVFIGLLLVPPVALKIASTGYRFVRYYAGAPAYRRKGPPPALLRLLGPVLIVLTLSLLATGVALLFVGPGPRAEILLLHKANFVLWFGAMTLHVLGHLVDTARLAPRDWYWRTRRQVKGASTRQWSLAAALVLGILLAAALVGRTSLYLGGGTTRGAADAIHAGAGARSR